MDAGQPVGRGSRPRTMLLVRNGDNAMQGARMRSDAMRRATVFRSRNGRVPAFAGSPFVLSRPSRYWRGRPDDLRHRGGAVSSAVWPALALQRSARDLCAGALLSVRLSCKLQHPPCLLRNRKSPVPDCLFYQTCLEVQKTHAVRTYSPGNAIGTILRGNAGRPGGRYCDYRNCPYLDRRAII
jgi:hypothetical protein